MTLTPFRRETGTDDPLPRNRRRIVLIAVTAVVVLAVFCTWLIAFSSVFGVRTVEVHGTHLLSVDQVRAAAHVEHGTPIVRVDTSAITRRVETLAEVESAQVSTSFPSTVVITIEERAPVGYVVRGGRVRLVDHSGTQYRTVGTAPGKLPKFVVPTGQTEHATSAAVAAVAAALPPRIRRQINSIQALDPNSISLVLTRDRVVQWGSADRTADKAQLLPALLKQHGVHGVDLTDPDQPFTR